MIWGTNGEVVEFGSVVSSGRAGVWVCRGVV